MKNILKNIGSILGIIVLTLALIWFMTGANFSLFSYFAPKYEQVRYNTFEQSQSYNQGVAQTVMAYKIKYEGATPSQKDAIADYIIHETASYDINKLPPSSKQFVEKLRRGER